MESILLISSRKHFVFVGEGEKTRNKVLKNHITVSVVTDLGCGNTIE